MNTVTDVSTSVSRTWLDRTIAKLYYLLHCSDTDLLEFASAMATFAWGVWTAIPWKHQMHSSFSCQALTMLMPEQGYGAMMILLGGVQFIGLFSQSIKIRRLGTICAFMAWAWLASMFLMCNFHMSETIVYIIFSIFTAVVYLRSGHHYILRN